MEKENIKLKNRRGKNTDTSSNRTCNANLKRHRYIMDIEDNPLCAKCGMEETAIHLITECPGYVGLRIAILRRPTVQEDSIREYPIYNIRY